MSSELATPLAPAPLASSVPPVTHERSLVLVPRDGLFCKDGRGWYTSENSRAGALGWPFPSTVRGALTTACGFLQQEQTGRALSGDDWKALQKQLELSGLLPLRRSHRELARPWGPEHRIWPVPLDAEYGAEGTPLRRLVPVPQEQGLGSLSQLSGAGAEAGSTPEAYAQAVEQLCHPRPQESAKGKPVTPPSGWTDESFIDWLCDKSVIAETRQERASLTLKKRTDVRVVLESQSLTAKEGGLYSLDVFENQGKHHEWALATRATLPTDCPLTAPLTIGGKGRMVLPESGDDALWRFPEELGSAFAAGGRGIRLVVVTPAHFKDGWLLPGFKVQGGRFVGQLGGETPELVLCSAVVPRPQHVSGWDMKEGKPKQVRRLVPPGAVYFLIKADGSRFTAQEARKLWLKALGCDQVDGLGRVVAGSWHPSDAVRQQMLRS